MSSKTNPKQGLAWAGILAVLGVTMWIGWKAMRDARPEEGGAAAGGGRPPSTVIFKPAEKKEMVEFLAVTGTLRALHRAEVAAREAAAVESMEVNEGDLVEAGAVTRRRWATSTAMACPRSSRSGTPAASSASRRSSTMAP